MYIYIYIHIYSAYVFFSIVNVLPSSFFLKVEDILIIIKNQISKVEFKNRNKKRHHSESA